MARQPAESPRLDLCAVRGGGEPVARLGEVLSLFGIGFGGFGIGCFRIGFLIGFGIGFGSGIGFASRCMRSASACIARPSLSGKSTMSIC